MIVGYSHNPAERYWETPYGDTPLLEVWEVIQWDTNLDEDPSLAYNVIAVFLEEADASMFATEKSKTLVSDNQETFNV